MFDGQNDANGFSEVDNGGHMGSGQVNERVADEHVEKGPTLQIDVIEGPDSTKNQSLLINAQGLKGSLRNKQDGQTIIGSSEAKTGEAHINDFVIKDDDLGIGKRHMIIKYDIGDKRYLMRDLSAEDDATAEGSDGTYLRVDRPLVLKKGQILNFGTCTMVIDFIGGNETGTPNTADVAPLPSPSAKDDVEGPFSLAQEVKT